MKIGILTLPLHTNYGGILQAYALQTVLERMGHQVLVFDKEHVYKPHGFKAILIYGKRFFLRYFLFQNIDIFAEKKKYRKYKKLTNYTNRFINHYLNTKIIGKLSTLKYSKFKFDAIVVGSDQVWRPKYIQSILNDTIENAFLCFTSEWNIKRLSYAASFGTEVWEYSSEETKKVKLLIHNFDAVSVREESGVILCSKYLDQDALHVLDPTLLLNREDYEALIVTEDEAIDHDNMLFDYILDSNDYIERFVNEIAKEKGLKSYRITTNELYYNNDSQPSVEKWLKCFQNAKFVITDSFHACVFCIVFKKPFVVIGNKDRGYGRFESLMKIFNLEKNLLCDVSEYNREFNYEIPSSTYSILKELKQTSYNFLYTNLYNKNDFYNNTHI